VTSQAPKRPPERLIRGKYGHLLRQANREWEWDVDEAAAFRRLSERMVATQNQRAIAWKRWFVVGVPFGFAALATVVFLARGPGSELASELVAETWQPSPASPVPSAQPLVSGIALPAVEGPLSSAELNRDAGGRARRAEGGSRRGVASAAEPQPVPSTSQPRRVPEKQPSPVASGPGESAPPPDCLRLAREGQSRAAEACFVERAQGAGLAAEMALHELARLRRDVLADPNGALRALADYRTRFPTGSLRRELDVSQLELLLQLGRSDDALKQSDELLSSSSSGERASELRLLRGHILRKQSRFAEAIREYEFAERGGARAADAPYFRAICLESLGKLADAAAAFAKYLEQPHRPYAEDAKRRLEKIKP
jgi:hypothetical protein